MTGIDRKNVVELVDPNALLDGRSGRPRRVPKKIQELIKFCLSGACTTIIAAADRVGLSHAYCYKALRLAHVRKFISDQTRGKLDEGTILAAGRLVGLINAKSEHVSLDATRHALSLAGYNPPRDAAGVTVNVNTLNGFQVFPGYVIDLDSTPPSKAINRE